MALTLLHRWKEISPAKYSLVPEHVETRTLHDPKKPLDPQVSYWKKSTRTSTVYEIGFKKLTFTINLSLEKHPKKQTVCYKYEQKYVKICEEIQSISQGNSKWVIQSIPQGNSVHITE
ncbi:hypothetical protein AVEN_56845-1 [Araneus ventricosus]|uniref:Uncharacterized protein n=1 Tax=Araneus ventricosus TaxID=182803 RepID=A0A4Y2S1I3_ARAVE|nr:hypothetical protein AVEN_56845-1 [Araneus ventricosus]